VTLPPEAFRDPPRLLVRTLLATFGAIVVLLGAVFVTLTLETRARVSRDVATNLDASQRSFATLERRRQAETRIQLEALGESPTLKAALDTWQTESRRGDRPASPDLLATLQHETNRLATHAIADAVVVVDAGNRVIASAGPRAAAWPGGTPLDTALGERVDVDLVVERPMGTFRVVTVPLEVTGAIIGRLLLATAIDAAYVRELSDLSRAQTAVVAGGRVIATTLDANRKAQLEAVGPLPEAGIVTLGGDPHAVRLLFQAGSAGFYAVDSVAAAAAGATRSALEAISLIACGALALGAVVSLWLARTLARPIDQLSQQVRRMSRLHEFSRQLPRLGSSRELDDLTDTFNELMRSLVAAEAATEEAYLAAIKALAAALDARDPYTSGHSERVSALSVMVGRELGLGDDQIDVLRLGALLHDIGKIGIRDRVLSKNGPLTGEEYEIIKTHPTVGAHILRQVPFLEAHMPIVELHHEQPDGRGYPHGLTGHATPLVARIVHVADAFDAMTSARAYRPAQTSAHAMAELRRGRGTQFDASAVDAFVAAWERESAAGSSSELAPIIAAVQDLDDAVTLRVAGGAA
jgi:putative nucleotidyltransferase with HDIG domain